ncbi:ribosomal-processing cysteine protease Prp [Halalkalibacillus sediminis]|uniref:Ribosomal processing cysteine protease Prp n=1 Tax=Halalkalibacillus sediminis TaxID=2018042 RepID=A0A2I0QXP9_9BACI|nr:ribosomal-processing cysteine protease Prp [Halalkalibacillus sediminis]PKR79113.1 ribosomal-processing cysteine protease Prp [Halalkalibacillus sediminis]
MIEMMVFQNKDETIIGFELSGHANSGPHGHDLVCAAVSAVSFGTVNSIISICKIEPEIDQGAEGGYLRMMLPDDMSAEKFEKAQTLLQGMLVTFQTIEKDYSQYINISKN